MADGAGTGVGGIERLPQDLLSRIISLTSPKNACRCSSVSTWFCAAAEADAVWSRFLPADITDVLDGVEDPTVQNCSKKELSRRLRDRPALLKGGQMSFGLDKWTGAKEFMLAARYLWGAIDQRYLRWYSHPESRFLEVTEFLGHYRLAGVQKFPAVEWQIRGSMLSSNKFYAAYLIFQLLEKSDGINGGELEVNMANCVGIRWSEIWGRVFLRECGNQENVSGEDALQLPNARDDGWLEARITLFYTDEADRVISISLSAECPRRHRLIVEGIEIRLADHHDSIRPDGRLFPHMFRSSFQAK